MYKDSPTPWAGTQEIKRDQVIHIMKHPGAFQDLSNTILE